MPLTVRPIQSSSLVLVGLLLIAACAGHEPLAPPSLSSVPYDRRVPLRYPEQEYLIGHGESFESLSEAETCARADVARQVTSSIEAESRLLVEETATDGLLASYRRFIEETVSTTSFSHAEEIRVDQSLSRCDRGRFSALAFLSKGKTLRRLRGEYDDIAASFRPAVSRALDTSLSISAYAAALHEAERHYAGLSGIAVQIRGLENALDQEFEDDRKQFRELAASRVERLGSIRICVDVSGMENSTKKNGMSVALTRGLRLLGLHGTVGSCAPNHHLLRAFPRFDHQFGRLGHRCELRLPAELIDCDSHAVIAALDLSDSLFIGHHLRDGNLACDDALRGVTPERLADLLAEGLAMVIPMRVD